MRVLHVDASREWRGGQAQLAYLVRGPGEHHVVTPVDAPLARHLRERGAKVHELPLRGPLVSAWPLASLIRRLQPHVVAAHTAHGHRMAVRAAAGVPVVVHRRVDFDLGTGARSVAKYAAASGYIAVSAAVSRVLQSGGVPQERVVVVHDGVPERRRDVEGAARLRSVWGVDPHTLLVGAVGALVEHKGHEHLVRAMALLCGRRDDVRCVILGEGELRRRLQSTIRKLRAPVQLVGWQPDVCAALTAMEVFAHPSVQEGMGQAVVEAMWCGVPVVCSAAGGLVEVVEHEVTGRLVAPADPEALADALDRTLRGRREAAQWAEAAQIRAGERFSVERMIDGTLAAYARFAAPR